MGLQKYNAKRDFAKTPEPKGGRRTAKSATYIIQKHDATRLHYDLRLQVGDVLASWAIPKGPSLDTGDKRLAVHVEDHPLDYATFEGVIPQGQYGGGTVMLWDRGTWTPDEPDPEKAIARGKLGFTLDGERLKGSWALVRMHGLKGGDDNDGEKDNWLLLKHDDAFASTSRDVTAEHTTSIDTGRTMDEIAAAEGTSTPTARRAKAVIRRVESVIGDSDHANARRINRKPARKAASTRAPRKKRATQNDGVDDPPARGASISVIELGALPGAKNHAMPRELPPQLCTLTEHAPTGSDWLHEIKFDGYRLVAHKDAKGVRLMTRAGLDWTSRFAPIADAVASLDAKAAILDGEACVLDAHGHTDFQALQGAIKARRFVGLVYFAFDLLYLNGFDLRDAALIDRKNLLRTLVPSSTHGLLRHSDHVIGGGDAVRQNACELALEGIICKRINATYESGRSRSWVKVKCSRRQEFVVIGYSAPGGSRKHFGSLLLGAYTAPDRLTYMGRVGTGFTESSLRDLMTRLKKIERRECPADEPPTRQESRGVKWVDPELVAEVEFTQMTDDGRLRHPSFQGLREDKPANAVRLERPITSEDQTMPTKPAAGRGKVTRKSAKANPAKARPTNAKPAKAAATSAPPAANQRTKATTKGTPTAKTSKATTPEASVAGVRLTNPGRVLYPEQGITKLDIAGYYESVADRIMPFLLHRPLSTVRCPQGRSGQCFFQKHLRETFGPPVTSIRVHESDGPADYIAIDSLQGLIALVQFGVLEIHPWGSTDADLDRPDMLTFDLDPGDEVDLNAIKHGARAVRERLDSVGLVAFLKTSGGKGLHVVVPVEPDVEWDQAKEFCHQVALSLSAAEPTKYVANMSKAKRKGRIFVDYLRNGQGATSVAAYSTRARAGAPVSMPISWDELDTLAAFNQYNVSNARAYIDAQKRDPWASFDASRRSLRELAETS
jgi:bifunctional non-homologous end joining protein LigD